MDGFFSVRVTAAICSAVQPASAIAWTMSASSVTASSRLAILERAQRLFGGGDLAGELLALLGRVGRVFPSPTSRSRPRAPTRASKNAGAALAGVGPCLFKQLRSLRRRPQYAHQRKRRSQGWSAGPYGFLLAPLSPRPGGFLRSFGRRRRSAMSRGASVEHDADHAFLFRRGSGRGDRPEAPTGLRRAADAESALAGRRFRRFGRERTAAGATALATSRGCKPSIPAATGAASRMSTG
jgi:hypothetical protein